MVRVIGTEIPDNKKLVYSLRYLYGIGPTMADKIIEHLGLDPDKRANQLTEDEIARLNTYLQASFVLEGDLRRQVQNNIKRLIAIHSYRGTRHRNGLPCRGQRTRSNARTRKGRKKTVAGKKKAVAKK